MWAHSDLIDCAVRLVTKTILRDDALEVSPNSTVKELPVSIIKVKFWFPTPISTKNPAGKLPEHVRFLTTEIERME